MRRAILARAVSALLGLLLVFQLAGLPHHGVHSTATVDAKSVALAGLKAAIGEPVTLCDHGNDPSGPGDPADHGSCDHCIFCHSIATALATTPVAATVVVRIAISSAVERPGEAVVIARARRLGSATPRGPPLFG